MQFGRVISHPNGASVDFALSYTQQTNYKNSKVIKYLRREYDVFLNIIETLLSVGEGDSRGRRRERSKISIG